MHPGQGLGKLQWGPVCSDGERADVLFSVNDERCASMGPRLFGRGKACTPIRSTSSKPRFNGAPSVRTGKANRAMHASVTMGVLQWGPVCSDGERYGQSVTGIRRGLLQWGPVCSDGERAVHRSNHGRGTRFNGAPSVRTGKVAELAPAIFILGRLQWGPVCSDGESPAINPARESAATLQWGPVCSDGERAALARPLFSHICGGVFERSAFRRCFPGSTGSILRCKSLTVKEFERRPGFAHHTAARTRFVRPGGRFPRFVVYLRCSMAGAAPRVPPLVSSIA